MTRREEFGDCQEREPGRLQSVVMHAVAEWITLEEPAIQILGQSLDKADFERESRIGDLLRERPGLGKQRSIAQREACNDLLELRRRLCQAKRGGLQAVSVQCVERDVDAIEVPIVFATVLKMVDDLQRGAKRVG